MRAHYLQHVPFEGLGSIEPWLEAAGYQISCTPFYETTALPTLEEIDLLVVMGGPMSVNDEMDYPWLREEKAFVKSVIEAGKPVLGVCLGAQLIASAMGAEVYPNTETEIGWFPVKSMVVGENDLFQFPAFVQVFHWHGETFDLPPHAKLLASSVGCVNQAFQLGERVFGLQFHLETTPQSAKALVENCRDELIDARFVQNEEDLLSVSPAQYEEINGFMEALLRYLTRTEYGKS